MKLRDSTREKIKSTKGNERLILMSKYKKLRNLVNQKIRKENIYHNEKRVDKAKNEGEVWKIVNEVIRPKKKSK